MSLTPESFCANYFFMFSIMFPTFNATKGDFKKQLQSWQAASRSFEISIRNTDFALSLSRALGIHLCRYVGMATEVAFVINQ